MIATQGYAGPLRSERIVIYDRFVVCFSTPQFRTSIRNCTNQPPVQAVFLCPRFAAVLPAKLRALYHVHATVPDLRRINAYWPRDTSLLDTKAHYTRVVVVGYCLQTGLSALAAQGLAHQAGERYPDTIGMTRPSKPCCSDSELPGQLD